MRSVYFVFIRFSGLRPVGHHINIFIRYSWLHREIFIWAAARVKRPSWDVTDVTGVFSFSDEYLSMFQMTG